MTDSGRLLSSVVLTAGVLFLLVFARVEAVRSESSAYHGASCRSCHIDPPAPDTDQPGWITDFCLFCHDGSSVSRAIHLEASHPSGVRYETGTYSTFLKPAFWSSGLGGTIADGLLVDGYVECTSCHDVHSNREFLLPSETTLANLCMACHDM
ncbi:MAG: cytochrome c3 family protein [Thermoanaerobaculia bacterium]